MLTIGYFLGIYMMLAPVVDLLPAPSYYWMFAADFRDTGLFMLGLVIWSLSGIGRRFAKREVAAGD
jgi:hypothetical protein